MSSIVIKGNTSGQIELAAPAVAGTNTLTLPASSGTIGLYAAPQVTVLTSGTGTYTTPTGAAYLIIEMVGGGSGGSGAGTSGTAGTSGGNTTFGTSFLTCNGGTGGSAPTSGFGGTATGGDINVQGSPGSGGWDCRTDSEYQQGGNGGDSFFGGGGRGGFVNVGGNAVGYGSGGGGGGVVNTSNAFTGGGGGAGGYLKKTITSPSSSYSYAIGAGGAGGAGLSGHFSGGSGASSVIMITAYFG
jgi:hypothetical protein